MTDEQKNLYDLLVFFDTVCRENGLHYWLAGGTLLGAVRHHGFIPWDDDIDIIMPEEDYHRLRKIADRFPRYIQILSEDRSKDYPFCFLEICDTRHPFQSGQRNSPPGIYIDVFPLIASREPTPLTVTIFNMVIVIGYVLLVKCGWGNYVPYQSASARIAYRFFDGMPISALRRLRNKLVTILRSDATKYCLSYGGAHKGTREFYPKEWLSETVFMRFEGKDFPVQKGWDANLKQLYGDYMILPDAANRVSHHKITKDRSVEE